MIMKSKVASKLVVRTNARGWSIVVVVVVVVSGYTVVFIYLLKRWVGCILTSQ